MRPLDKEFFRDNLLGLSLTFIGVLCLVLSVMLNLGHHSFSKFALADGGLDGPDIDILERQNKAYERIAQSVTPAVVNIRTTQMVKVQQSPFFSDPFFRQFFGDRDAGIQVPSCPASGDDDRVGHRRIARTNAARCSAAPRGRTS